jgi:hypothetical protein
MIAYEDGHLGSNLSYNYNTTFKLCPKQIVCKYNFKCVGKSHKKQLLMGCEYTHVGNPYNLSIPILSHFEKRLISILKIVLATFFNANRPKNQDALRK